MKVYPIPGRQIPKWSDLNDADVGYSEMEILSAEIRVPWHINEDSLLDTDLEPIRQDVTHSIYSIKDYDKIQSARNQSYWLCEWIDCKLPMADTILVEVKNRGQLIEALDKNLSTYPFVRLCSMSPKDQGPPIFSSVEKALLALDNSIRTQDRLFDCHLVFRELRHFSWEARCFFSRDRLTAVSCDGGMTKLDEPKIINWFKNHKLPYHSAVVDIGLVKKTSQIELIEFNSFGPDMLATAGLFSWAQDMNQLLFGKTTEFRYVNHSDDLEMERY